MGWYIKDPWVDPTPTNPVTATALTTGFNVSGGTTKKTLTVDVDGTISDFSGGHTQGTDTALGAVGTKNPPIDADKAIYRDSTASDVLVTSTWTQIKAFLKTYFDTIYHLVGGTDVPITDGGTGQSTAQLSINALTAVSGATNEHVLTKDTATGNAIFKASTAATYASAAEIQAGTEASKAIAPDQLEAAGLGGNRVNKTQADSPYAVTAADLSGLRVFTNTDASDQTVFQLPAGADGYKFKGRVTAAQYMKFLCNGTENLRYLATQSAAGGYVRSNVIGYTIEGEWSGTEWVITGIGGAWAYDS